MQFGMNLFLWTDRLNDSVLPVVETLRVQGWDGVEVPVFDLTLDYAAWGKRMDDFNLRRTAVTVRNAGDNPISPDAEVRAAGVDAMRRTLDCCRDLGAEILAGPFHSAIGQFTGQPPTADEWRWGVESMRQMAEYADQVGITLAVEYLNRFECYFLNHAADVVRFVKEVNHPRCRIIYDTFHGNIEEKDPCEAIRLVAPYLAEVHISENDRSTPGHGNIRWSDIFRTLREIEFDGWLVIEAFGMALPALQAATKIWRRMFRQEDELARNALELLKSEMGGS